MSKERLAYKGICYYCNKDFVPGDILTTTGSKDIVHLECSKKMERMVMAERLNNMTKDELIEKVRWILKNENNHNDWSILDDLKKMFGITPIGSSIFYIYNGMGTVISDCISCVTKKDLDRVARAHGLQRYKVYDKGGKKQFQTEDFPLKQDVQLISGE